MAGKKTWEIDWKTVGLGTQSDKMVAANIGCSPGIVSLYRRQLGIPCSPKLKYHCDWDNVPFGEQSDEVLAKDIGCSASLVRLKRRSLGLPPISCSYLTQEGYHCRSSFEAKYDAWLHSQHIAHKHEVRVPGLPYIADFEINGKYVEIFGMRGYSKYDAKTTNKIAAYKKHNIPFVEIPLDEIDALFSISHVNLRLSSGRKCIICGCALIVAHKRMCKHCYDQSIKMPLACSLCSQQYRGKQGSKFCSNKCSKLFTSSNPLISVYDSHPDVIVQWHYVKNILDPKKVSYGSKKKAWWICCNGHEWEASMSSRCIGNTGCPYCSGNKASSTNCLSSTHPDLAADWDYAKNEGLTPNDVKKSSGKNIWWKCKHGFEWYGTPTARACSGHYKCEDCFSARKQGLSLLIAEKQ